MKKVVLGFSLGLALACAPELRAGKGERCDEAAPCAESLQCYRGFCIPGDEPVGPEPVVADEDGASSQDGGGARSSARDAGIAASSDSLPSASSAAPTDASAARASDAQASPGKPSSDLAVTAKPATVSDAAAKPTADPGPAKPPATTPPPSTPAAPLDAGVSPDAALVVSPDAALPKLPKDCTLEDCCAEAARSNESKEGKAGKRCGCEDPALLRTLSCTVGGVVGGVVGVLL